MRQLLACSSPDDKWLVFNTRRGRDAAVAYFTRRRWYVVAFTDVQGPALHAARVHWTAPPSNPRRRRLVGV